MPSFLRIAALHKTQPANTPIPRTVFSPHKKARQMLSRLAIAGFLAASLLPNLLAPVQRSALGAPFAQDSVADSASEPAAITAESIDFFERKVRPILVDRCFECHSGEAKRLEGSLRLDHKSFYLQGGDSGPALDESDWSSSLFLQAIRFENYEMPPSGKLPAEEIDILTQWVEAGAYWPEEAIPDSTKPGDVFDIERRKAEHWVWKAIERNQSPPIPSQATQQTLPQSNIDAWIQAKLSQIDLQPAPTAGRATLIRRLYWDLLGLPPSAAQLEQWNSSTDADWYSQLLDSLLADPQFGVRFGRHWLDSVRYAQSRGHEFDEDIPGAEQYRDYVIRAFNADVPYDQLLREHLAGDLLAEPRRNPSNRWNESVIGTGFWHLGEWIHSPVDIRKDETDRFDNMVDVFSKSFLGLTVACARCHDHKFDAISTADYYAMFGFLRSSHYTLYRFENDEAERQIADKLSDLREECRAKSQETFQAILADKKPDDWQVLSIPTDTASSIPSLYPPDAPELVINFTQLPETHFRANGLGFGQGPLAPGWSGAVLNQAAHGAGVLPSVNWSPVSRVATDAFWHESRSLVTRTNSSNRYNQVDQAGKTLNSPWITLSSPKLHFLVRGNLRIFTAIDSYRFLMGPLHGEVLLESKSDTPEQWRWVTSHDLSRYLGKSVHIEFSPMDSMGCEVLQIATAIPAPLPPLSSQSIAPSLYQHTNSATNRSASFPDSLVQSSAFESVVRWLLQSPDALAFSPKTEAFRQSIQRWQTDEQKLATQIPRESQIALGMIDGIGQNDHILIRGNSDRPGDEVVRRNLEALNSTAKPSEATIGSGRLELAEALLAEENPLVARVIANRLWHHLLGRGIVATTDDFGVQGRPPTHPELLDELAQRLRENGWSIKALIREICSSHTYCQQTASGHFSASDPNNELLAFSNTKKLQGEVVRDALFSVAGQLNTRLNGGTPKVYLSEFLTGRGRPRDSGPLHGDGRRSIYLEVRRNFLNPMLTAFDMPTPFSSMGRRNVSNVPAQALTMLNDPLVHWLAEQWAAQISQQQSPVEERVRLMFMNARGREPSGKEMKSALEFLGNTSKELVTREAWQDLAHVLLNSKELQFNF